MADDPVMERVERIERTLESLVDLPVAVRQIGNQMGSLEARTAGLEARTAGLEARTAGLEARTAGLEAHTAALTSRVERVELQIVQLRTEMKDEFSAVRRDVSELGTQMRVLHEDVIERISRLG